MEISCEIIRDLLPLYAENLTSPQSNRLVDDHLCSCDECTKMLGNLQKGPPIPAEIHPESLEKVRKTIIRRRMLSAAAAVMTLLTLGAFVISFLFAPFQLTREQALDDFYVREDGAVVIDYSPYVVGRQLSGHDENWFINQYSTRYDMWKGDHRKSLEDTFGTDGVITEEERIRYENIDVIYGSWESEDGTIKSDAPVPGVAGNIVSGGSEYNWWYSDPTGLGQDVLLHDAGKAAPEREERYCFAPVYPMIVFGGILVCGILLVLRRFFKKAWTKELTERLLCLIGSAVVSTLFVASGRFFTSYAGVINQYWGMMIGTNSAFLTLTALFWRQLYLLNKQDKGL